MIKEQLLALGLRDGPPLHLLTATLGGTIAVTVCAPVDVIKSRVQSARGESTVSLPERPGANAQPVWKMVTTAVRTEGPSVLFRGWLPAWLRMTPTTCLTFVFLEQLKRRF
jgi:dicarboxylate transporter 10